VGTHECALLAQYYLNFSQSIAKLSELSKHCMRSPRERRAGRQILPCLQAIPLGKSRLNSLCHPFDLQTTITTASCWRAWVCRCGERIRSSA
jgi:hypothetical protein